MEPESSEPDDVDNNNGPLAEPEADPSGAIGGTELTLDASQLREHHSVPEVSEVEAEAEDDNDAEGEHVLASPLNVGGFVHNGIAVVATSLAVLNREDEGIDDVEDKTQSQNGGASQGVPVGAEEGAHSVVASARECSHKVHAHVEKKEEHEEDTRHAHDQLLTNG